MTRVVLDTNVIVSALVNPTGLEAKVVQLVLGDLVRLIVSNDVFAEYKGVLHREKFAKISQSSETLLSLIRDSAEWVTPVSHVSVAFHEDDNRFLESAEAGKANYLVTGNKKHFPASFRNTKVVNARELFEFIHPH